MASAVDTAKLILHILLVKNKRQSKPTPAPTRLAFILLNAKETESLPSGDNTKITEIKHHANSV